MTVPTPSQPPEDAAQDAPDPNSGKGLRAQLEATQAELAELRARSMAQAFDALGLDPTEGIGKAVAVTFDGEPEQLGEFAEAEFGYVPEFEHPYANAIRRGQAELDALQATGGSVPPSTRSDQIAQAEARGDTDTSIALKSDQLSKMFGRS